MKKKNSPSTQNSVSLTASDSVANSKVTVASDSPDQVPLSSGPRGRTVRGPANATPKQDGLPPSKSKTRMVNAIAARGLKRVSIDATGKPPANRTEGQLERRPRTQARSKRGSGLAISQPHTPAHEACEDPAHPQTHALCREAESAQPEEQLSASPNRPSNQTPQRVRVCAIDRTALPRSMTMAGRDSDCAEEMQRAVEETRERQQRMQRQLEQLREQTKQAVAECKEEEGSETPEENKGIVTKLARCEDHLSNFKGAMVSLLEMAKHTHHSVQATKELVTSLQSDAAQSRVYGSCHSRFVEETDREIFGEGLLQVPEAERPSLPSAVHTANDEDCASTLVPQSVECVVTCEDPLGDGDNGHRHRNRNPHLQSEHPLHNPEGNQDASGDRDRDDEGEDGDGDGDPQNVVDITAQLRYVFPPHSKATTSATTRRRCFKQRANGCRRRRKTSNSRIPSPSCDD